MQTCGPRIYRARASAREGRDRILADGRLAGTSARPTHVPSHYRQRPPGRDRPAKLRWQTPLEALVIEASALGLDERQQWQSGQLHHFADNRQLAGRPSAEWRSGAHRLEPTLYATQFDHLARRATSSTPLEGTEAFVQATAAAGPVTFVPGVRATVGDAWGTHWTPRLALLYRPLDRLAVRASVGQGFRAPEFKELHMEFLNVGPGFGYVVRGNPELQPELSRNVTAGVEWTGERLYMRAQAFSNEFEDFIESGSRAIPRASTSTRTATWTMASRAVWRRKRA